MYVKGNLTRFFSLSENNEIQLLVYKRYLDGEIVLSNEAYKQQLLQQLECNKIGLDNIEALKYEKKDLVKIFTAYNQYQQARFKNYAPTLKKDVINVSLRPGVKSGRLVLQNATSYSSSTDFGAKLGIRLGIETEFILPYNNNKWSIILEPTYQQYKSEVTQESSNVSGGILISKVDCKSMELPLGVRHYFFLNNKSKLFTNLSLVMEINRNSYFELLRKDNPLLSAFKIQSRPNLALGFGYAHNNKYSMELRYGVSRNVLNSYSQIDAKYKTISLIIGYTFL